MSQGRARGTHNYTTDDVVWSCVRRLRERRLDVEAVLVLALLEHIRLYGRGGTLIISDHEFEAAWKAYKAYKEEEV